MSKEKIKFKNWKEIAPLLCEDIIEEDNFAEYFDDRDTYIGGIKGLDEFNFIQEEQCEIDLCKGYITYEVIIQRVSDSKYFKGEYTDSDYWDLSERFELDYIEVEVIDKKEVLIYG